MEKRQVLFFNNVYIEKTKFVLFFRDHKNWSLIRGNKSVDLDFQQKIIEFEYIIHGNKIIFWCFLNHKIKIKNMERNTICIVFHKTHKKWSVIHGKKLHYCRFSQKQKSNRCVIWGKKTCFIVLTKPQILNLSFTWKKQNLYCFHEITKNEV